MIKDCGERVHFTNIWEQSTQGREKSQCKCSKKGATLIYSRKSKEASELEKECAMGKSQKSGGESDQIMQFYRHFFFKFGFGLNDTGCEQDLS